MAEGLEYLQMPRVQYENNMYLIYKYLLKMYFKDCIIKPLDWDIQFAAFIVNICNRHISIVHVC